MAREHLESRSEWQGKSVARGHGAEDTFSIIMDMHIENSGLSTRHKPKDLQSIYGKRTSKNGRISPHGIHPEFAIGNPENGKIIYVEIKRQRAAGNAHERACKYMMPGILQSTADIAGQRWFGSVGQISS